MVVCYFYRYSRELFVFYKLLYAVGHVCFHVQRLTGFTAYDDNVWLLAENKPENTVLLLKPNLYK